MKKPALRFQLVAIFALLILALTAIFHARSLPFPIHRIFFRSTFGLTVSGDCSAFAFVSKKDQSVAGVDIETAMGLPSHAG
jgi:hypothetical protein